MRVAGTPPLCVAGGGKDGLLQLHRRLVQPGAAALRLRLPLAHGLRTGDGGPTNGSVINQARQHSTKTGQLQSAAWGAAEIGYRAFSATTVQCVGEMRRHRCRLARCSSGLSGPTGQRGRLLAATARGGAYTFGGGKGSRSGWELSLSRMAFKVRMGALNG